MKKKQLLAGVLAAVMVVTGLPSSLSFAQEKKTEISAALAAAKELQFVKDEDIVSKEIAALNLPGSLTTGNLTLPGPTVSGSAIEWTNSKPLVIANDGTVTYPEAGASDETVTMTAAVTYGNATDSKTFTVLVKAPKKDPVVDPNKKLELSFDGDLKDSSQNAITASAKGTAVSYVNGIIGQAASLTGGTYLDLGMSADLSPETLSLSFWINPNKVMSGEQAITWNKTAYNSDGWYLMSEGDSKPLALSVGPATGQPYKISVNSDRSEFFPTGEWTHVTVTYDSASKKANFYRNGVKLKTNVDFGINDTATGVIGPCETFMKSVGFNGPNYKGAYLNAALDEYTLYNKVIGQEDVISLYEDGGKTFDKKAVAQSDADALMLPSSATGNLTLITEGEGGSTITWGTSNENVLASDGTVTRPEAGQDDASVTMTATVSFAGSEAVTRTFTVMVPARPYTGTDRISDTGIDNITLSDSYLMNAAEKENDYLLSLSSKKFLYEFYVVSGLTPPTTDRYQGWERSNGTNFRGHTFGHYMSALSQAYSGTQDADKKAVLLVQIKDAVNGMKECQDAYAVKNPSSAGYVSAFRESILNKIDGTGNTDENVIVPWYNLHKVLAGLIDIYTFVDDKALADQALAIAEGFSEYVYNRCSKLTDNSKMLGTEYGGMNEALYELYDITGNDHFKSAAQYFDEVSLFSELAKGKDVLSGKHANTTIPKLIGALKRYTVLTQNETYYNALTEAEKQNLDMYLQAAQNFWQIVIDHHTYITGGNSQSEHFHQADKLYADATKSDYDGSSTCETCNTYNMLKLSRELYKITKEKKYMDYYENTYINAILSSQNPETGTTMYFQPMAPGYNKVFNRPEDEFWCCTGTGMENFSKLGDTLYFTEKNDVYVNMYYSNTFQFAKQNLKLTQTANLPNNDEVTVTVAAADGTSVAANTNLRFRIPDWAVTGAAVTLNGTEQPIQDKSGYAVVSNVKAGDTIKLKFPMEVKAYDTQDKSNFIAFKYGPVVLSAGLGSSNIEKSNPNGILVRVGTKDVNAQTVILVNSTTVEEWKRDVVSNLVRIEDSADGQVQFKLKNTDSKDLVYTPHFMRYKERYGLYMTFEEPDSQASQERILAKKETLRSEEMNLDFLYNFDENNSEYAKNLKSENSGVGTYNNRQYRDAKNNGWFSYDMQIDPAAVKNYLKCTYYSGDKGRKFDIHLNGEKFKTVTLNDSAGTNVFYIETDEIPEKYWKEPNYKKDSAGNDVLDADGNRIPVVNVKFQSNGGLVGGLYGIATSNRNEYSKDAELSGLTFSKGTLSPVVSPSVKSYTLKVPTDTTSVLMKASPNMPSGLIYIGNILIDDTLERLVTLTGNTTTLNLTAKAQDHETAAQYTITIEKTADVLDTKALTNKITAAKAIQKGNYTDVSFEALQTAIKTAEAAVNTVQTEAEVTDAVEALQKAIDALELKEEKVLVNKITFTPSSKTLTAGQSFTFRVNVYPSDANNKAVTLTTSNSKAATVSGTKVTARAAGAATITATAKDGSSTKATMAVKVQLKSTTSVKAQQYETSRYVKVRFSKVSGAKGYDVYRSTKAASGFKRVGSTTSSSYTDKKVKAGTKYYYKIVAKGSSTSYNSVLSTKSASITVLAQPSVKAKAAGKGKVNVSWKKVKEADGYVVYTSARKTKGFKTAVTVKKGSKVKAVLKVKKGMKTCYIKVRSYQTVSGKKVYGPYSKVVSVRVK